jgi:CubicO group peptidase (beta-lactamase class C family)
MYSVAMDVMARLVEIVSGQRFDTFIQSRILGPPGMVDTGFVVPEKGRSRSPRITLEQTLWSP